MLISRDAITYTTYRVTCAPTNLMGEISQLDNVVDHPMNAFSEASIRSSGGWAVVLNIRGYADRAPHLAAVCWGQV